MAEIETAVAEHSTNQEAAERREQAAAGDTLFELPPSPLKDATDAFVQAKIDMAELKVKLEKIEEQVLTEMKKEDRPSLVVSVGGENYLFEIKHGEDKLRCIKQTRTPTASTIAEEL